VHGVHARACGRQALGANAASRPKPTLGSKLARSERNVWRLRDVDVASSTPNAVSSSALRHTHVCARRYVQLILRGESAVKGRVKKIFLYLLQSNGLIKLVDTF